MIGFHFQHPVNDWPAAVKVLPPGTPVKALDNVQLLNEAKAHNPSVFTILRHWYDDGQQFDGGYEGNLKRARDFFKTFVDGTFAQYAPNVDAIEGFNEYNAWSHTPEEIAARVDWVKAVNNVWTTEYRTQDKYRHIRLVTANCAVGNDIPFEAAKIVYTHDGIMGYHAYFAIDPGRVIHPGDWQYYGGRWAQMDAAWRGQGVKVDWLFTEGGPIRRRDDGGLDPQGGWRHPDVCNGDVNLYIDFINYFLIGMSEFNRANEGRAKGLTLFNTGNASVWQHFETAMPEMLAIAENSKEYYETAPPPPVEPPPIEPPPVEPPPVEPVLKFQPWYNAGVKISDHIDAIRIVYQSNTNQTIKYDTVPIPGGAHYKDGVRHIRFAAMKLVTGQPIIENITNELPKHATLKYQTRNLAEITTLTIHHTVSPSDRAVSSIAAYHVDKRGWPGIGYHFVIKDSGAIYQTNELITKSYHAGTLNAPGDENLISVGVALQGDFTNAAPPSAQLNAARELCAWLVAQLPNVEAVKGHKEMPGAQTACPGATSPSWLPMVKSALK